MEGYAKIASRISLHPELGIFRRFSALNAQNLLYLQAEIHELEANLREYAAEDAAQPTTCPRSRYSRNWHKLANSLDHDRRQWQTMLLLREKLKEYNEALTQQALIARYYRKPRDHDLDVLRTCLRSTSLPDYLLGLDSTIWDDPLISATDLISLTPQDPDADDRLTTWISSYLLSPFHSLIGRHYKSPTPDFGAENLTDYSDKAIVKVSSILATVVSSVFPIVGVIILFFVEDLLARIGIVASLTAVFSAVLAVVTRARKVEIFAATAA